MSDEIFRPGLEGVVAGDTSVCSVEQDGLFYRGYDIADLATQSTFEECAYLLLHGELPDGAGLGRIKELLDEYRPLHPDLVDMLRRVPRDVAMMDVLRTALSAADHFSPSRPADDDLEGWQRQALYLSAQVAGLIAARQRLLGGEEPVEPTTGLGHAAQLLYQFSGEMPTQDQARLLDLTLILYMEHEFNASTFVARVCASTLSDLASCIVGGIGTLKGPLHGGANEAAMDMLLQFESAEQARNWTLEALRSKRKVMGFGHRVYRKGDHRARILEAELRRLAGAQGQQRWMDIYDAVKNTVESEKGIFPNVDYPCGLTYYLLKLPVDVYTPLFVASRIVGWSAHVIEQHFNNRLIRPRSRYIGPPRRAYVSIDRRG